MEKPKERTLSGPAETPSTRATSSRNGGRNHFGTPGEIISDSRATSPGIRIQTIFWISFFIFPFSTGLLAYRWLPNEAPMLADGEVLKPFQIISSHEECNNTDTGGKCGTIVDIWKNTETGNIYTKIYFKNHRINERNRMTVTWFLYGLIACIFFAWVKYYQKKDFFRYFGIAITINMVIAIYTYLTS
jgi:hypothetical protein